MYRWHFLDILYVVSGWVTFFSLEVRIRVIIPVRNLSQAFLLLLDGNWNVPKKVKYLSIFAKFSTWITRKCIVIGSILVLEVE